MESFNFARFCLATLAILLIALHSVAQDGYQGIIPMESTCHDVRRILGMGECGQAEDRFMLEDEVVRVEYTTQQCQFVFGKRWKVPVGTVIQVIRSFRKSFTLDQLGLSVNESDYTKDYTDAIGQLIYEKKGGGLSIHLSYDRVNNVIYTPILDSNSNTCFVKPDKCSTPSENTPVSPRRLR